MTRSKPSRSILGTILVMWLAVGCGGSTATPKPPATPSPTAGPTATPILTPTPAPTPTPTVGPGGFPRRFHVKGNALVDQFGKTMIFRGVDAVDPVLQTSDPTMPAWNENYYKSMADWGANIIRVPITMTSIHVLGMDTVLTVLDQTLAWAGAHKMYVIIDFHSVGWIPSGWYSTCCGDVTTTVAEWTSFWKTISTRYAGNDVVAMYELFNEPQSDEKPWLRDRAKIPGDWTACKGVVDTLIAKTIRPNDPAKIVLVGGTQNAYNLSYAAAAPIADPANNVAYAEHPYASQNLNFTGRPSLSDWDKAFGDLSSKHPVVATEFSYLDASMDPVVDGTDGIHWHQAVIDYMEAHHISWTAWSFSANWPPGLVTDNRSLEPSTEGAYFRSRLWALNFPGATPPPLPTPYPTPTGKPGNLAHGKPVTASSIQQSDLPAINAIDGDPATRWGSGWSDPQWIRVDLGATYHINRVVLSWDPAYGVAYKIQVSNDGSTWTTIYSTTKGDGGIDDLTVSGSGRYVRMYGTERHVINGARYGYSLFEFEVYGSP